MDISIQELKQKKDSGEKFVFIDVREQWEYDDFNLGAKLIPLGTLMTNLDDLGADKEDEIIIHCKSGARSGMAKQLLEAQGYKNVRNTLGGILAWIDAFGK